MDFDLWQPGQKYELYGVGFSKQPQEKAGLKKYPASKLSGWPRIKGSYLVGNPLSPVVVVIPMPDTHLMEASIEAGAAIAGSMVTANHGIERVIANVVANPNLRWIILFGRESQGHKSGEALEKVVKNGVNDRGEIVGASGITPFIKNIPIELVERLREQVKVVNLLGYEHEKLLQAVVKAGIQEPENAVAIGGEIIWDPGRFEAEPLHFDFKPRVEGNGYYEGFGENGFCFHCESISQAWKEVIGAIMMHGKNARVESDIEPVRELRNVMIVVHEPLKDRVPQGYSPESWTTGELVDEYLQAYAKCLLAKEKMIVAFENGKIVLKPANTTYTYGSRLRDYNGVDQIQKIVEGIKWCKKKGIESYRLYGVLEDPVKDLSTEPEKVRPPCFALFQVFPRRMDNASSSRQKRDDPGAEWTLDLFCYMRAWDFHRAAPANMYGFSEILKYLAEETGCKIGTLTVCGGSVHIYGHEL